MATNLYERNVRAKYSTRIDVQKILKGNSGIRLDIGCGEHKQKGFVGLDRRKLEGVDIIHDLQLFPYPLPDDSCVVIVGSHIVEHINPQLMLSFMDELWRITKPDGQLALSMPYAGSPGYWQDPTHCNGCNQATWQYFDPRYPLYEIYKSKPWQLEKGFPVWQVTGNMEVLMFKLTEEQGDKLYEKAKKERENGSKPATEVIVEKSRTQKNALSGDEGSLDGGKKRKTKK